MSIKTLFTSHKRKKEIIAGLPNEINYSSLLSHIFKLGKSISRDDLDIILKNSQVSSSLDNNSKERLIAFYHYFRAEWQLAMNLALPLATSKPYDQDMIGLASSILNNAGRYKDSLHLIEAYADEPRIESKEMYYVQRGSTAWCAGDEIQAKEYLGKALELNPNDLQALGSLCGIYNETGNIGEAKEIRTRLLELAPNSPNALFNEGIYKLGDNEITEGMQLYELRYAADLAPKYFREETLNRLRWDGSNLAGKRVYIYFEQGLGDTLMTCRYLSDLNKQASRIIAECQPEAKDLLQSNFPDIEFFNKPHNQKIDIEFDVWIGSMSLPYLTNKSVFPQPYLDGYLKISEAPVGKSPIDNHQSGPKIGISWSGNPGHANDPRRSIPWQIAKKFIELANFELFAVQTHIPDDKPENLISLSDYLITLTDTAEIISQLDLIITVDTSLVHLAGALGKKTWLLCHQNPEWRWGKVEGKTRWYESVTLYKQKNVGDWQELLERVMLENLKQFIESYA